MSDEARQQLRREDCRMAVRDYLYDRGSRIAQTAATIHRNLRKQYDFSEEEVEAACLFWVGEGQFEVIRSEAGATQHFRINSAGIKGHERSLV